MAERQVHLSRDATAVARARRWLTEEAADHAVDGQALDDLLVMASELVTNVLMHTTAHPVLTLSRTADHLRVAVFDDDPHLPRLRQREPERAGGNGLLIVNAWATDWGVDEQGDTGKTVWFTVPMSTAST